MRVTTVLDIAVLILLATVLLMPRPDAKAKPALNLAPETRGRVAELQAVLLGSPGALEPSMELANLYIDARRPDWALATLAPALKQRPDDYRLHHLRAVAFADRFESPPAYAAATRALELCEKTESCGEAARGRLHLLKRTLERIADVDMRENPAEAQERIRKELRPVWNPKPRPKTTPSPRPAPGSAPSSPKAPPPAP
jgi:hypothetical protein